MASTLKSGGFIVSPRKRGSGYDNGGMVEYMIANNTAGNILPGDPVKINGTTGGIVQASVSTDYVVGVFAGLKPEGQASFIPTSFYQAGTSARSGFAGAATLKGLVIPAEGSLFEIQVDGSVSLGDLGRSFDVTVGTGTTLTTYPAPGKMISTARVHASSRSAAGGVVKIVGFSDRAGEAVTDAYPYVVVQFNNTIDTKVSLA